MIEGGSEQGRVRVGLASAVRLYRESLALVLPGLGVAVTCSGSDPIALVATAVGADVLLIDATDCPPSTVRAVADRAPDEAIVILGVRPDEAEVLAYIESGACGYVTRQDSLAALVEVVHLAARGEAGCSPRVVRALMRRVREYARDEAGATEALLTPREVEILELIDQGLSNKEIAFRLHIELPTVKNHVHHLLKKLGVRRRGEACARVRAGRGVVTTVSA